MEGILEDEWGVWSSPTSALKGRMEEMGRSMKGVEKVWGGLEQEEVRPSRLEEEHNDQAQQFFKEIKTNRSTGLYKLRNSELANKQKC